MVTYQVIAGLQPFPGENDDVIIHNVATGERPSQPPCMIEWVSDDIWNFISRCWSASRDDRPDVEFVVNVLNDATNASEASRVKSYGPMTGEKRTPAADLQ
ncbi:hypothetical protein BJ322DRAFT_272189 [Thelephora terrestris]|uniref:Serine-threonine/tyrosine-protein kinase catalytic domain-containing protein n=1 Tax=Thelephora terrestris TaxID=56493 RepID=A0A9P6H7X4_9AGAM|nr:hypothetical protein BJ322DRAFT_272189 [Thelephora terrestris]